MSQRAGGNWKAASLRAAAALLSAVLLLAPAGCARADKKADRPEKPAASAAGTDASDQAKRQEAEPADASAQQAGQAPPKRKMPGLSPPSEIASGMALVEARCKRCHSADKAYGQKAAGHDRAWWERTLQRMTRRGARLSESERQAVIDYLTTH